MIYDHITIQFDAPKFLKVKQLFIYKCKKNKIRIQFFHEMSDLALSSFGNNICQFQFS